MSRRRGRRLSEEERALWDRVAQTAARRLPARKPDAPEVDLEVAPLPPLPTRRDPLTEAVSFRPFGRSEPAIRLPDAPATSHSGLDKRTEARLRKGQRQPDARLDLHGMTANRAHAMLIRFIGQARAAGHRCVLVITGKGAPGERRPFGEPAPGVIRREAPIWLSTPPLSSMVVHVSGAHPRHGGGGALYVYLKKPR